MVRRLYDKFNNHFKEESFAELVKSSASTFAVRIGGLFAGYLFTLLVSRLYGPDVLGAHTISLTVLMVFTIIGRLGMDFNIVKHFAKNSQENRWDRIREVYRKTLKVVVPVSLVFTVIYFFTAPIIADKVFHKPHLTPYFRIMSFAVLPMVLRFINAECYRGFRMHRHYAYSQNVSYFLYGTVILGALSLFYSNPLLPNVAFVVALILLAVSSTILIRKRITSNTLEISDEHSPVALLTESAPMLLSGSLMLVSGWINTIILGIFADDSQVGIYSVILKISTLSTFVLMSINAVSAPRFAQLYAAGDTSGLSRYTAQTAKVIFFSSVPIFLIIILFRHWLLGLFGTEFTVGSAALLVSIAGQFFNVFAGSVGHFLNMTGHQRAFRNIITASTIINILLCLVLIPRLGIMGSAIAGMVFVAGWNLSAMIYIRKKFNIRTYYWPFQRTAEL